jgi:uncharacterized protein YdhG (YjbR/CyaY superfamily)
MATHSSPLVDDYIARFPDRTQTLLQQLRNTIREEVPDAEEVISYQMPAYKWNGMLVYFAGYEKHIGFYPTGTGIEAFHHEFAGFKWSKGAVQFPLDRELPLELVRRMVRFRLEQNSLKTKAGKKS